MKFKEFMEHEQVIDENVMSVLGNVLKGATPFIRSMLQKAGPMIKQMAQKYGPEMVQAAVQAVLTQMGQPPQAPQPNQPQQPVPPAAPTQQINPQQQGEFEQMVQSTLNQLAAQGAKFGVRKIMYPRQTTQTL